MLGLRPHLVRFGLVVALSLISRHVSAQSAASETAAGTGIITVGIQDTDLSNTSDSGADAPQSYDADLFRAVARAQGLQFKFKYAPLAQLWADLEAGRIDVIPNLARTPERAARYDLTVPHSHIHTGLFVRRGDERIRSIADLSGRAIIVVAGSFSEEWCEKHGWAPNLIRVRAVAEAVQALASGQGDCLLTTQDKALETMHRLNISNLVLRQPAEPQLEKEHCMVVRQGNRELLAKLNEGLFVAKQTGELDRVYEKWRGVLRPENPWVRFKRPLIAAAIALVLLAGGAWLAHHLQVRRALAQLAEIEKRVAERTEELRRTEEFQRLVLQATNDGIFDHDLLADRFDLSARGWQMLGYGPHELPATLASWWQRLHPEDREAAEAALRRHRETRAPYVHTARFIHRDGSVRWLYCRADTLCDTTGRPIRMVGSYTDITDLKRIDEELQLSRRLRALGELVGGIAHEFNNLLTPILLEGSLLLEKPTPDLDPPARARTIVEAARRAQTLTQRLLQLGRRRDAGLECQKIATVAENTLALVRTTFDRRITIRAELDDQLAPLQVNTTTVGQAVMNLVINARDTLLEKLTGSPPPHWRPQITVILARHEARARGSTGSPSGPLRSWQRLSVVDNGMGLPPDVRARMFEPFFTTKALGQGTGLGLAMVWAAAAESGGWVETESTPGEGSTFHLYLPDVTETTTTAFTPGSVVAHSQSTRPSWASRRRLLLVDDDPLVGASTLRLLTKFGHEVSWLRSGDEARPHFADGGATWDAMITDLNMPGLGGEELTMHARRSGYRGKIVVISGQILSETESRLRRAGADAVVTKPFDVQRLRKTLDELWDTPSSARSPT